jgi:hypothetical protein
MSDLSCTLCEQVALAKVSIELEQRFIFTLLIFSTCKLEKWRFGQKGECFLNDFEALVREIYIHG